MPPQVERSLAFELIVAWMKRAIHPRAARMNAEVEEDLAAWLEELAAELPVLRLFAWQDQAQVGGE